MHRTGLCTQMMMQLCSAVQYLHGCGFVHGNISSANVYVATSLRIKLAGFRTSEIVVATSDRRDDGAYVAPRTPNDDVYFLAMCLWELATERPPVMLIPDATTSSAQSSYEKPPLVYKSGGGFSGGGGHGGGGGSGGAGAGGGGSGGSFAIVGGVSQFRKADAARLPRDGSPWAALRTAHQAVRNHQDNVDAANQAMEEVGLMPQLAELIVRCWVPDGELLQPTPTPTELADMVVHSIALGGVFLAKSDSQLPTAAHQRLFGSWSSDSSGAAAQQQQQQRGRKSDRKVRHWVFLLRALLLIVFEF